MPPSPADFFRRHVLGTEPLPYRQLLAAVGYDLRARETPPTLGQVRLQSQQGRMVVAGNTVATSALYKAGLGTRRHRALAQRHGHRAGGRLGTRAVRPRAGAEVDLVFESRGEKKTARVTVEKNDRLEVVPMAERTPQQEALRAAWLSSKVR